MDYTDLARVKQEIHIKASGSTVDDALLSTLITAASRAWDRKATNALEAVDYFASGSMVGEKLEGQVDYLGNTIRCYPHKPYIIGIQAFSYQENITKPLYTVDAARVDTNGIAVTAYPLNLPMPFPGKCKVTISYTGGLGASISDLPADMVEAVSILAARFYREAETGLSDQMGVAELTTMVYTKAWPIRCEKLMNETYKRRVGWRHTA